MAYIVSSGALNSTPSNLGRRLKLLSFNHLYARSYYERSYQPRRIPCLNSFCYYMPGPGETFWNSAIRLSVRPMAQLPRL